MSRVIKRYENRKLYDTEDRRYVSLEEIAALVREGNDIHVIDMTNEADITTQTLTQVIFEEGKHGRNPLSKEMLHDVIRWSNQVLDGSLKQVKQGIDHLAPMVPTSLTKFFGRKQATEVDELKKRVESLEALIGKLAQTTDAAPPTPTEPAAPQTPKVEENVEVPRILS